MKTFDYVTWKLYKIKETQDTQPAREKIRSPYSGFKLRVYNVDDKKKKISLRNYMLRAFLVTGSIFILLNYNILSSTRGGLFLKMAASDEAG